MNEVLTKNPDRGYSGWQGSIFRFLFWNKRIVCGEEHNCMTAKGVSLR